MAVSAFIQFSVTATVMRTPCSHYRIPETRAHSVASVVPPPPQETARRRADGTMRGTRDGRDDPCQSGRVLVDLHAAVRAPVAVHAGRLGRIGPPDSQHA